MAHPEQGPQPRHVQPGPGPVHDGVEGPFHDRTGGEDEVAAVLDLIDRVGVAESAAALLVQVQPEAQAGGVNPPVDDLAQAPYSPGLGQGVCDLSQALGLTDAGEAVALLREGYARRVCLAGHVLVAVEDDLRTERRVTAHLDRQMPKRRVDDVERVVIDELPSLLQVADPPGAGAGHLPHRRRRPGHQDQEHARADRVLAQELLGDAVLAVLGRAVDHRHPVRSRPRPYPPGEPAGQPDQVRVVQRLITVIVQPAPPRPEPARVVPQREVRVEHDPVHTVIRAGQQLPVAFGEFIDHPRTVGSPTTGDQSCPEGATRSGRSPGAGIDP